MLNIQKFHLPFRNETAFSLLAFCVFLVPLCFSLISYENFESSKLAIFFIFTGLAGVTFLLKFKNNLEIKYNKFYFILLFIFLIFSLFSALFAEDKLYSFFGFYYRFTSSFIFFLVLALFSLLFVTLINREKLVFILKILVVDALLVAIITYLQGFGWIFYPGLEFGGFYRGPSLLGNPNYSAMFLECVLPFAVYLFFLSKTFKSKLFYLVSGLIILVGVLLLASRGAVLALVLSGIAFAILFLKSSTKKKNIQILISFLIVLISGYFLLNSIRPVAIESIASGNDSNAQTRIYAWKTSFLGIKKYPFLGVGLGNYALFFEKNRSAELAGSVGVFDDAHNLYLQMAVSGGLPQVILFLSMLILAFIFGVRKFYNSKDNLYLAFVCSLIGWVVAVLFNPVPIPMFLLLVVILTGLTADSFYYKELSVSSLLKFLVMLIFALIAIFGAIFLVSESYLGLAKNSASYEDYSKAYKYSRISNQLNPTNPFSLVYMASSKIALKTPDIGIEEIINKNLSLHPTQTNTFVSTANLYYYLYVNTTDTKYLRSAISNMEQALVIDPYFSERYGQLALYYFQLGDLGKSKQEVLKAVELQKDVFSNWMLLAKLYQLEGNKQETINNLEQAFKLNPNLPQLKYLIQIAKNTKNIKEIPLDIGIKSPKM